MGNRQTQRRGPPVADVKASGMHGIWLLLLLALLIIILLGGGSLNLDD